MEIKAESNLMKDRVYKILFIATIVCTLFNWFGQYLPGIIRVLLVYETYLSLFPAFLLALLIFIDNFKNKRMARYKYLLYFFIIYFVINSAITIHSAVVFRFAEYAKYDTLETGPKYAYLFIKKLFPSLSDYPAFAISFVIRTEINLVREFIGSWFIVYSIALYFVDNLNVLRYFLYGTYIAMIIELFYGIFEIAYRMGYDWGEKFLVTVNPYLYPIGSMGGVYPVILPGVDLRGMFTEGSFFSYWGCMFMPFMMSEITKGNHRYLNGFMILTLISYLILTAALSAVLLIAGVVVVFYVFSLITNWKNKNLLFLLAVIVLACLLGAVMLSTDGIAYRKAEVENSQTLEREGVVFNVEKASFMGSLESGVVDAVQNYKNKTVSTSLDSLIHSNNARFASMYTAVKVFLDYPIFGVGKELAGFYVAEKAEESEWRVDSWCAGQRECGSLVNGFPMLDIYTESLLWGGIFGFIIEVGPVIAVGIFLLILFIRYKKKKDREMCTLITACLSSIAAIMLYGVSNQFLNSFLYFIIMGMSFGVIMKAEKERNEELRIE